MISSTHATVCMQFSIHTSSTKLHGECSATKPNNIVHASFAFAMARTRRFTEDGFHSPQSVRAGRTCRLEVEVPVDSDAQRVDAMFFSWLFRRTNQF